ncbi:Hypothetical protein KVN_LOCUS445 [uncultured virus]|nr:Hypothetical protein KVN_LOCUS445 [uncultured virus]
MTIEFEFIRNQVEINGYILLSDEVNYKTTKSKLKLKCPKGHIIMIVVENFINRKSRCIFCSRSKPRKKHKKNYDRQIVNLEIIKLIFEKEGYQVLNKTYENYKTNIRYICPNNHQGKITFYLFNILKTRCGKCRYEKLSFDFSLNIEQIKKEFENLNFILLSTKYEGYNNKLEYECPSGHYNESSYAVWRKSKEKCYTCYITKMKEEKKFSHEKVKQIFEAKGCKLLTENYINAKQKLNYVCPQGHNTIITLDGFSRTEQTICGFCSNVYKHSLEKIQEEFSLIGYELLSTEYINAHNNLKVKCNKGHIIKISYTHFKSSNRRCGICKLNLGPKIIKEYLDKNNIPYELEYKFNDCKDKRELPFDFYVNNQFLIEFDGKQHFKPIDYFGGIDAYTSLINRDFIKTSYCIYKKIPLLRISFLEFKIINQLVENFIKLLNENKLETIVVFSNLELVSYKFQKLLK